MARGSLRATIDNFRTYDAPLPTKLRLSAANTWKKQDPLGVLRQPRPARLLSGRRPAP